MTTPAVYEPLKTFKPNKEQLAGAVCGGIVAAGLTFAAMIIAMYA